MFQRMLCAALANMVLTFGVAAQESAVDGFVQIDYPGATATGAYGINSSHEVVGWYTDSTNKIHGYVLSRGKFTLIDYPGAKITNARGINEAGDVVGTYQVNTSLPGGDFHGFLWHKGVFKSIEYPGHLNTIPQRITDTGTILGCYHDQDQMGTMHGMMFSDGAYTALDGSLFGLNVPASMNNGGTPGGILTGLYTDMMLMTHGYVVVGGGFVPFDVPGSRSTQAWDMNARAQIVGIYVDAAGKVRGFATTDGTLSFAADSFFSVDFPGASRTQVFGINKSGEVAGRFFDSSGHSHAFVYSAVPFSGN